MFSVSFAVVDLSDLCVGILELSLCQSLYCPLPFGMCFIPPYVFSLSLILIFPSHSDLLSLGLIPPTLFLFSAAFFNDLLLQSHFQSPCICLPLQFFLELYFNTTTKQTTCILEANLSPVLSVSAPDVG